MKSKQEMLTNMKALAATYNSETRSKYIACVGDDGSLRWSGKCWDPLGESVECNTYERKLKLNFDIYEVFDEDAADAWIYRALPLLKLRKNDMPMAWRWESDEDNVIVALFATFYDQED